MSEDILKFVDDTLSLPQTSDALTLYEKSNLIAMRAIQISNGSAPLVKIECYDPIYLAEQEFINRVIPLTIVRKLMDGTTVTVDPNEMLHPR